MRKLLLALLIALTMIVPALVIETGVEAAGSESGEFPNRTFTVSKGILSKSDRSSYTATILPTEACDWWVELVFLDGAFVKVEVLNQTGASISSSRVTSVGAQSEHVSLEGGGAYEAVLLYVGKRGSAVLNEQTGPTFLEHALILIDGDAEFTSQNGVVSGDGTSLSPYVIEGWEIDISKYAKDLGAGIRVLNTEAHFVIRDCYVHSGNLSSAKHTGMSMRNCSNVTIESDVVMSCAPAIHLEECDRVQIRGCLLEINVGGIQLFGVRDGSVRNCTVRDTVTVPTGGAGGTGLSAWRCLNLSVVDNTIARTAYIGMFMAQSNGVTFARNTVSGCGYDAIRVQENVTDTEITNNIVSDSKNGICLWVTMFASVSDDGTYVWHDWYFIDGVRIRHNDVRNCVEGGITCNVYTNQLTPISNIEVTGNTVEGTSGPGIYLLKVESAVIHDNTVRNNTIGVRLAICFGVVVYWNNFVDNAIQALDESTNVNTWDGGMLVGGNYWSDYTGTDANSDGIGDTPYVISSGNMDRYPLMHPVGPGALGWQEATLLQSLSEYEQAGCVGMDDQGNALVIWEQPFPGNYSSESVGIWWIRYDHASGWGQPAKLWDGDFTCGYTTLDVGPNGQAVAAWYAEADPYSSVLHLSLFDPASGWSSPTVLPAGTGYGDLTADVDENGNAIVIVESQPTLMLTAVMHEVGSDWRSEVIVSSGGAWPSVRYDGSGCALLLWNDFDVYQVKSARYVPGVGWGPVTVASGSVGGYWTEFDVDDSGLALATFFLHNGTAWDMYGNVFDPATGWGTPTHIGPVAGGWHPFGAFVASAAPGEFFIVWEQTDNYSNGLSTVWSRNWTAWAGWGPPIRLSPGSVSNYGMQTCIAANDNGEVIASWTEGSGAVTDVVVARFTPGQGWGTPVTIDSSEDHPAGISSVAIAPNGDTAVIWRQSDGVNDLLWGRIYLAGAGH